MNESLRPLDVGSVVLTGFAGRVIMREPYVKLLTDPYHDGIQWRALAQVEGTLCIISLNVTPKKDSTP